MKDVDQKIEVDLLPVKLVRAEQESLFGNPLSSSSRLGTQMRKGLSGITIVEEGENRLNRRPRKRASSLGGPAADCVRCAGGQGLPEVSCRNALS